MTSTDPRQLGEQGEQGEAASTAADPLEADPAMGNAAESLTDADENLAGAPVDTAGGTLVAEPAASTTANRLLNLVDAWLSRVGDRFNPILVKEARQALKSRQFVSTFFLLLSCAWGWTLLGVAVFMIYQPDQSPPGDAMLIGYFLVLVIPILLVIPFSAFRSLAGEREDGTFELVSITTLSANQIVLGKLSSALLQMLLCFSVLAPCMVFTYVLRGVDLATIGLVLGYSFFCSLFFTAVGLLIGATSKSRHWNTFFSVVVIVAFCLGGWGFSVGIVGGVIMYTVPTDEPIFWTANLTGLTIYMGYVVIMLLAAGAQVSFASDNRSTRLRIAMVVQQLLIIGWGFYYISIEPDPEVFYPIIFGSGLHWMLMGWFMIGESGRISPRARRNLPHSAVGRALFTWFNPGSRTGYLLVVANMLMLVAMLLIGGEIAQAAYEYSGFRLRRLSRMQWTTVLVALYVIFYLGVANLALDLLRQFGKIGLFISLMVGIVSVTMGAGIPPLVQQWYEQRTNILYSPNQALNWVWSIAEALDGHINAKKNVGTVWVMGFCATLALLGNLAIAVKDVMLVATTAPRRVLEDDAS